MRSACSPALRSSRVKAPKPLLTEATCLRVFLLSRPATLGSLRRRGRAFAPRMMPPAMPAIAAPPAISGARSFEAVLGSGGAGAGVDRERFVDRVPLARDCEVVVAIPGWYPVAPGQISGVS